MKQRTSHDVDTRLVKNGKVFSTNLTLDWSGVSEDEMQEMAARSIIISAQRIFRDAGKVPTGKHTEKVRDLLDGKRPPRVISVERLAADAGKMKPEEIAALVKELGKLRRATKNAGAEETPEVPAQTPGAENAATA